ncbi:LOW QUALITY PROTEIN: small integral membrane protein 42 [Myotis daubentonii]|uniref:LOW QUALITY PROTEIN: small integral membrane protein 42 n=1 Tax=Myotis daubentonii TaxID=98922 RepID=UPI002872FE0F|nr:LOW QUALITY PROTEIN: small integral membrane protein 42 [Myotis daubentonii]
MSFPQFPAILWGKSTLATSTSDPVYIVKVLFFIALLMTLVTLLILAYRVFRSKSYNKNLEPDARKEPTLPA